MVSSGRKEALQLRTSDSRLGAAGPTGASRSLAGLGPTPGLPAGLRLKGTGWPQTGLVHARAPFCCMSTVGERRGDEMSWGSRRGVRASRCDRGPTEAWPGGGHHLPVPPGDRLTHLTAVLGPRRHHRLRAGRLPEHHVHPASSGMWSEQAGGVVLRGPRWVVAVWPWGAGKRGWGRRRWQTCLDPAVSASRCRCRRWEPSPGTRRACRSRPCCSREAPAWEFGMRSPAPSADERWCLWAPMAT